MEALVISLLLLMGLVWYVIHMFRASDAAQTARRATVPQSDDDPIRDAQRVLKTALEKCNADHHAAVQALLWLAASDGTISKQEARNVFRFCEQQGTTLPTDTSPALEYLNNGMSISMGGTQSEATERLSELRGKPIQYRAAFIGAAHAICGGNKRISKVKQDFLDRANRLVDAPT